eukprot:TRINITY_DN50333_c0_g1_i1.p1 TRINITY_DN50333_c0_g1~~TRINITY_DN50333_c0_g1_i1.p1  ORF type:complete len:500 (+),score=132.28 TRINITY_DN50333_c0_g1_i1:117-1616(+)
MQMHHRWRALLVQSTVLFISAADMGMVLPSLFQYLGEISGEETDDTGRYYGVTLAVFSFSGIVFLPLAGAWADSFGFRTAFIGVVLISGLGNLLYAAAGSLRSVGAAIAGRALSGASGCAGPLIQGYVARTTKKEERTWVMQVSNITFQVGLLGGGPLLNVACEHVHIHFGGRWGLTPLSAPGAILALAFFALALAVVLAVSNPPNPSAPAGAGTAPQPPEEAEATRCVALRAAMRVSRGSLGAVWGSSVVALLLTGAMAACDAAVSPVFKAAYGMSPVSISLVLSAAAGFDLLLSLLLLPLVFRGTAGDEHLVAIASGLYGAAAVWCGLRWRYDMPWWDGAVGVALFTAPISFYLNSHKSWFTKAVDSSPHIAKLSAAHGMLRRAGRTVGQLGLGAAIGHPTRSGARPPAGLWGALGGCAALSLASVAADACWRRHCAAESVGLLAQRGPDPDSDPDCGDAAGGRSAAGAESAVSPSSPAGGSRCCSPPSAAAALQAQ